MSEKIQPIDTSSNNFEPNSHVTEGTPKIKIPFPPVINPQDLISFRESPDGTQKLPSRAPNAFIIFRKQFVKATRDEGYFLPMTVISSMASEAWVAEGEEVKSEYRRIAKEAHIKRKAMYPKSSNRRRRKDRWNIVSFKSTNSSDSISAITSRIPNDQPQSQSDSIPSLNLENTLSPADAGDSSQFLNTIFPSDFDYMMADNQDYATLGTASLPYGYDFESSGTFGLYPNPNIYTSDEDSINSTSPYLDSEQFETTAEQYYNDYINSSTTTNTMTQDSLKEFNSIIENNIQQNYCYNDWQGFHDPTTKSREEKLENEDTVNSEQLDMFREGNCGENTIAVENWVDLSIHLVNGCFGEALGIIV